MSVIKEVSEKIIREARSGDRIAQAQIVKNYEEMVYNLALRLTNNKDEAEGVLQETFLRVLESLSTFRGDAKLGTWIYRIAANYALMRLRKRKRKFYSLDEYQLDGDKDYSTFNRSIEENPEAMLQNNELRGAMDEAIESLPPKFKTAFVLKDVQGFSLKEVAEILEMNIATVKTHIHRARIYLRDKLADFVEEA
jgi:RNA polymerase sigma-70 factor (ECF subfamily)